MRDPGGPLFAYLAAEVFEREPAAVRRLIRTVAPLDGFTPELLEALGLDGAAELLRSLSRRGLFLELHRSEVGWFSLSRLVRRVRPRAAPARSGRAGRRAPHGGGLARVAGSRGRGAAVARGDRRRRRDRPRPRRPRPPASARRRYAGRAPSGRPAHRQGRDPDVEELVGAARQIQGDWEELSRPSTGSRPETGRWRRGSPGGSGSSTTSAAGLTRRSPCTRGPISTEPHPATRRCSSRGGRAPTG